MNVLDEFVEKLGLKYEELTAVERDTYQKMYSSMQTTEITILTLREHIGALRDSVEQELEKYDNSKYQDLLLKARLKNYRLLEAFLTSPERAKKALERSMSGLVVDKK